MQFVSTLQVDQYFIIVYILQRQLSDPISNSCRSVGKIIRTDLTKTWKTYVKGKLEQEYRWREEPRMLLSGWKLNKGVLYDLCFISFLPELHTEATMYWNALLLKSDIVDVKWHFIDTF